jgi:prevent-host-death family protein
MTIHDYYLVMDEVGIAELKAKLSGYLRRVRRGESLTVLDRSTPIARIVPYVEAAAPLHIRPPRPGAPDPGKVALPPPSPLARDVVELLLEDRAGGR